MTPGQELLEVRKLKSYLCRQARTLLSDRVGKVCKECYLVAYLTSQCGYHGSKLKDDSV